MSKISLKERLNQLKDKQKESNIISKAKESRLELLNKKLNGAVGTIKEINIADLKENPYQPRIEIKESEIKDLASSIKQKGLLQPVIMTKTNNGDLIIVAGHRRVEAHKFLGKEKIKAIEIETNSHLLAELSLIENLQREDLDLIESAIALKRYKEEFNKSYEEIAKEIGKSKSWIIKILNILNLPKEIIEDIKNNKSTKDVLALNMLNSYAKKTGVNMFTDDANPREMGVLDDTISQKRENEIIELYKNYLKNGRDWLKKEIRNKLENLKNKEDNEDSISVKITKKHGVTVKIKKINKEKIDDFQKELKLLINKYQN